MNIYVMFSSGDNFNIALLIVQAITKGKQPKTREQTQKRREEKRHTHNQMKRGGRRHWGETETAEGDWGNDAHGQYSKLH